MRTNRSMPMVVVLLLCAWTTVQADRGGIPFKRNVTIYEPNQRAVLAWNGTDELLLLSTNLHASEPTKVLEVLPLPSEPKVQKGDLQVFVGLTNLINEKLRQSWRPRVGSKGRVHRSSGGDPPPPAGEVTFHEKIGAHDVSVTKVLNKEGFVEWVGNT